MKSLISTFLGASLLLALATPLSLAHTTATTSPKSGSVLSASPASIEIKFEHEASLTSVALVVAGKPDRKLDYAPKGSAKSFAIANANLVTGRNEIQWKALSKDGHVVSGSIVLTIDPSVQKTH
jgi:methionine-rich copper-binding protein CopC